MRRRTTTIAFALVAVATLATGLTGCRTQRIGARCNTRDFAQTATQILQCKAGRWRVLMTKGQYVQLMIALKARSTTTTTPPTTTIPATTTTAPAPPPASDPSMPTNTRRMTTSSWPNRWAAHSTSIVPSQGSLLTRFTNMLPYGGMVHTTTDGPAGGNHGVAPGYLQKKDDYLKRLRRIEGQARGLQRMVEQDQYCIDILTQVAAMTKALQAVSLGLLEEHLSHCVANAVAAGGDEGHLKLKEATDAISRLVRS